jgi:hypothetical protein
MANKLEAQFGGPFRLNHLANRVSCQYPSDVQVEMTCDSRDSGQIRQVGARVRFFVALCAKRGPESLFVWLGQSGTNGNR